MHRNSAIIPLESLGSMDSERRVGRENRPPSVVTRTAEANSSRGFLGGDISPFFSFPLNKIFCGRTQTILFFIGSYESP